MLPDIVTIYRIPIPPSEQDVVRYRALRLHALLSDPSSFSSNHAREVAFPLTEWVSRLDSPLRCTIVARLKSEEAAGAEGSEVRWAGIVSCLAPNTVHVDGLPCGLESAFLIMGMWVDPRYRCREIGKRLLQEGMAWAQESAAAAQVLDNAGCTSPGIVQIALKTHRKNIAATQLYTSTGFRSLEDDTDDFWMVRDASYIQKC